jgi:hypothetical protein
MWCSQQGTKASAGRAGGVHFQVILCVKLLLEGVCAWGRRRKGKVRR